MYWSACLLVFAVSYSLTIGVTSIGYHRGLTHGALRLRPAFRRWLLVGGHWITGIDPKTWVVMHRLHHAHSDTPDDPHSPTNVGMLGIPREQIKNYARVLIGLRAHDPRYMAVAPDVPMSWPVASGMWFLPALLHLAAAIAIGTVTEAWLLAWAYWAGVMSHGTQGVVINAFGHARGGRNFNTDDDSRNNHVAAWFLLGEGFQNNHHRYPASARFSYRWWELDAGFAVCRLLEGLGVLEINRSTLIPKAETETAVAVDSGPALLHVQKPHAHAPLPWMLRSRFAFASFRLAVYGTVGIASEIFFYNLTRWGRSTPLLAWAFRFDWRVDPRLGLDAVWTAPQTALYGQASLWMFFVYGLCSLFVIEPLYRRLKRAPFIARGAAYAVAILGYEWCAGTILRELTGVSIWVYADEWAIGGATSLALLPVWIGTGLFAEALYRGMAVLAPLVATARASAAKVEQVAPVTPAARVGISSSVARLHAQSRSAVDLRNAAAHRRSVRAVLAAPATSETTAGLGA